MRNGGGRADEEEETRQKTEETEEPFLLCCRCLHPITPQSARIAINGAHQHTFANPHGIVFDIGCFQAAEGCAPVGASTDEFTWFSGYRWRVALCRGCMTHMGWQFTASSGGGRFYGLILDHLIESNK
jgi:hypothetical protein